MIPLPRCRQDETFSFRPTGSRTGLTTIDRRRKQVTFRIPTSPLSRFSLKSHPMADPEFVPVTAVVIYWYDLACFAIVGAAIFGALYVLWKREGGVRGGEKSMYESLLMTRPGELGHSDSMPRGHVRSFQLWTSCWKGLHPGWLLGIRLVSFFTLGGFLLWDIEDWGGSIFIYYTEWTFTLVMLYFAIGSVVSAYGCWLHHTSKPSFEDPETAETITNGDTHGSNNIGVGPGEGLIKLQSQYYKEEALQKAGFWGYLMQTSYQTCAGAVILTDVVFWCVIVPFSSNSHLSLTLLMGFMHTLNAAFILLDTSLNSLPFPWFRISYFVLWSSAYIVFQWVVHACGLSWWPYPFLELSTPLSPLWYLILAVAHLPCYGMYAMIVKCKNTMFSKLFPHTYVRTY